MLLPMSITVTADVDLDEDGRIRQVKTPWYGDLVSAVEEQYPSSRRVELLQEATKSRFEEGFVRVILSEGWTGERTVYAKVISMTKTQVKLLFAEPSVSCREETWLLRCGARKGSPGNFRASHIHAEDLKMLQNLAAGLAKGKPMPTFGASEET